jgi:transcriptional regulator with XRE-family HTH domain
MPVLREAKTWSRPKARWGPDLSPEEVAHVKAALAFLRIRHGSLRALAGAMGVKVATVSYAACKKGGVSAGLALRAARAAGVPVEEMLAGRYPPPGVCPHCGRG